MIRHAIVAMIVRFVPPRWRRHILSTTDTATSPVRILGL